MYFFKVFLFIFLKSINDVIQQLWWKLTYLEDEFNASLSAPVSKKTVQVLRVVLKLPVGKNDLQITSIHRFMRWHEAFYPMNYLMKSNVSLYLAASETELYFIETDPSVDIYDIRKFPFCFTAQADYAVRLIRVHSADLIAYSKTLDRPIVNVVWVYHSARCGSTAMAQALGSMSNWRTISELFWMLWPTPRDSFSITQCRAFFNSSWYQDLASACIKLQLLHFADESNLCWKTTGLGEPWILPVIQREFPEHKFIYMTRAGLDTASSQYKLFHSNLWMAFQLQFFAKLCRYFPNFARGNSRYRRLLIFFTNGYLSESVKDYMYNGEMTIFEFGYLQWITNVACMLENGKDVPMMLIDYDYYMRNLEVNMKKVLDFIGMKSATDFNKALDAYKLDSQTNSALSRDNHNRRMAWQRNEKTVQKASTLAGALNLPLLDEPIHSRHFTSKNWTLLMDQSNSSP